MTAPTEDLIERLENHRVILKSGDYDGADLMRAWCAMSDAAQALRALQAEMERLRIGLNKISEGSPDIGPVGKSTYTHGFDQGCAWAGRVARSALTGSAQG